MIDATAISRGWIPGQVRVVYVVHHSYPYRSDGYAARTHGVAKALVNKGCSVIVVNRPGWQKRLGINWDVNNSEIRKVIDGVQYLYMSGARGGSQYAITEESSEIGELLKIFKPSVVMAASNWRNALPAMTAARALNLPFYFEVRGFWEISREAREPEWVNSPGYIKNVENETHVAMEADRIFTLNPLMKQELINRGVDSSKIYLAPNGYDVIDVVDVDAKLEFPERLSSCDYLVGYVGSFSEYEGLELLVRACGKLRAQGLSVGLMLVGSLEARRGGEQDANQYNPQELLLEEARSSGMEEYLYLPGRVSPDQLVNYYNAIDLVVIPRKPLRVCHLVMPMKPYEALAYNKPILVSDVDVLRDWAESSAAADVFSAGNVDDLADKVACLLNDPERRTQMVQVGRQWLASNTWDFTTQELANAIEEDTQCSVKGLWAKTKK